MGKKRAGGPSLSEARRREMGLGSIKLRLPLELIERLDMESKAKRIPRVAIIARLLERLPGPAGSRQ
jgi:hypothetical protein